jgi:hypothetical protein
MWDMNDTSRHDTSTTTCPNCGGHNARATVTVNSGPWERQFLECSDCGQAVVAAWRNTHYQTVKDSAA